MLTLNLKIIKHLCIYTGLVCSLSACESDIFSSSQQIMYTTSEQNNGLKKLAYYVPEKEQSITEDQRLSHLAGKIILPVERTELTGKSKSVLEDNIQDVSPFVGRYFTTFKCRNLIFYCGSKQEIKYVVYLSEDGVIHRNLSNLGRVTIDPGKITQFHSVDYWHYDPIHEEIVIDLKKGGKIYYKLSKNNDLDMQIDKTERENWKVNSDYFLTDDAAITLQSHILVKSN